MNSFTIRSSLILVVAISASSADAAEHAVSRGLCVQLGGGGLDDSLALADEYTVHRLERDESQVSYLRAEIADRGMYGTVTVERWEHDSLPYLANLVNLVYVFPEFAEIPESELRRVVAPGGKLVRVGSDGARVEWTKPVDAGTDEWTHQWHGADGALTSDDSAVNVPTGLQWIQGPLFAMDGRKSSTQSLVSAGGRNFYITQNVAENINRSDKHQYLVARDAYNGLQLWQTLWPGPFVDGSGETNPRLVAANERLWIATLDGVREVNAVTGELIREITLSRSPTKLLFANDCLLIQHDSGMVCERDGERLWDFAGNHVYGAVVVGQAVLCLVSQRSDSGEFVNELVRLDLDTGHEAWRVDSRPWTETRRLRINFAADDFVGLQSHGHLHVFSIRDGQHLWSNTTGARPGKDYADERFVGHFYRHGLVWMLLENSPREREGQNTWAAFDPRTGEIERTLTTVGAWPETASPAKMGCQLLIASDRYIMVPRQATFIDFETGEKHGFEFARGGCGLGFVPANGLVYAHPHACGCFSEAVRGFLAMHSHPAPRIDDATDSERLVRGPAYGTARPSRQVDTVEWSTYRGNASRGAMCQSEIPTALRSRWTASVISASERTDSDEWSLRVGNRITAPVFSQGMVFVADVQGQRLVAIDRQSGDTLWEHFAAGRIDSPPTIHGDLCLFGSHDGCVSCVSTTTGQLIWKYRVAPSHERIIAFGQLESRWPVAGTVLVQNGTAFAAAGRAPDADGGIQVVALDPMTGIVKWTQSIGPSVVGLSDYLVGDGDSVYLANCRFDPDDGSNEIVDLDSSHLRGGKVGLLEASWTRIDLALRKQIQDWTANGVAGQLLCFDATNVFGYRISLEEGGSIFSQQQQWEQQLDLPRQVHAVMAGPRRVAVSGALNRSGNEGGFLNLIDRETGELLYVQDLESPPVFDGMAAAGSEVAVSLSSGQLQLFGE